jgi:hypothetical protein
MIYAASAIVNPFISTILGTSFFYPTHEDIYCVHNSCLRKGKVSRKPEPLTILDWGHTLWSRLLERLRESFQNSLSKSSFGESLVENQLYFYIYIFLFSNYFSISFLQSRESFSFFYFWEN